MKGYPLSKIQIFLSKFFLVISVRRHSSNSRGPTPTEENGLADSTEVTGSSSNITVVTLSGGRFEDAPPTGSRLRCRDFDGKVSFLA